MLFRSDRLSPIHVLNNTNNLYVMAIDCSLTRIVCGSIRGGCEHFTSDQYSARRISNRNQKGPQATESHLRFAKLAARGTDLSDRRCFRRAPGPAPFSSINSTPAFSRALRMADALANVIAVFPSTDSARWIVARLTPDSRTRSAAAQRRRARAARIWAPKIFFMGRPKSPKEY